MGGGASSNKEAKAAAKYSAQSEPILPPAKQQSNNDSISKEYLEKLRLLAEAKTKAMALHKYESAKEIKTTESELRLVANHITQLEIAKTEAVTSEDFERAKDVKDEIDDLKAGIDLKIEGALNSLYGPTVAAPQPQHQVTEASLQMASYEITLRLIGEAKSRALASEDYDKAKQIKHVECEVRLVVNHIVQLEVAKEEAICAEDYERAKEIKEEMEGLKATLDDNIQEAVGPSVDTKKLVASISSSQYFETLPATQRMFMTTMASTAVLPKEFTSRIVDVKNKAIEMEDYEKARHIKSVESEMALVGSHIAQLEIVKAEAVASEDYERAREIKEEIDELKIGLEEKVQEAIGLISEKKTLGPTLNYAQDAPPIATN